MNLQAAYDLEVARDKELARIEREVRPIAATVPPTGESWRTQGGNGLKPRDRCAGADCLDFRRRDPNSSSICRGETQKPPPVNSILSMNG